MDRDIVAILLIIVLGTVVYFIPYIVAQGRDKQNLAAIGSLNLFLGWTLVEWVAAAEWAVLPQL